MPRMYDSIDLDIDANRNTVRRDIILNNCMEYDVSRGSRFGYLSSWVKWLRMQGHRLPATLEVTGSNPGTSKINLIKIEKKHQRYS